MAVELYWRDRDKGAVWRRGKARQLILICPIFSQQEINRLKTKRKESASMHKYELFQNALQTYDKYVYFFLMG